MFNVSDDNFGNYLGFSGGIIGAIIGGIFTLSAVQKTINLQVEKEEREKIPSKILTLDDMIEVVKELQRDFDSLYNLFGCTNERIEKGETINGKTPQQLLNDEINEFYVKLEGYRKKLIEYSAKVNSQTYQITRDYLLEIKVEVEKLKDKNIRQFTEISDEIMEVLRVVKVNKIENYIDEIIDIKDGYDNKFK